MKIHIEILNHLKLSSKTKFLKISHHNLNTYYKAVEIQTGAGIGQTRH